MKRLDPFPGRHQQCNREAVDPGAEPGWSRIVLIEDDSARARRRTTAGVGSRRTPAEVTVRVHRVKGGEATVIAEKSYSGGKLSAASKRGGLIPNVPPTALEIRLDGSPLPNGILSSSGLTFPN